MSREDLVDEPELEAPDLDEDFEDFDAFWAEHERRRRPVVTRIRGIDVEAPADLPLEMQLRADQLADATGLDEVRELLGMVLDDGVLDELAAAGVGLRELQVLLSWCVANGSGRRTTLAEAAGYVEQAEAVGKAPRRERRAMSRQQRTRSGGRSAGTGR